MIETRNPEIDVDELLRRIAEEVARSHGDDLPPSPVSGPEVPSETIDWRLLQANLDVVRHHAEIGNSIPAWMRFGRIRRRIARFTAHCVLYLSSFITNQQKLFNGAVLESLQTLSNGVRDLDSIVSQTHGSLAEVTQRHLSELQRLTARLTRQNEHMQLLAELLQKTEDTIAEGRQRHQEEVQQLRNDLVQRDEHLRQVAETVQGIQTDFARVVQQQQGEAQQLRQVAETVQGIQTNLAHVVQQQQGEVQQLRQVAETVQGIQTNLAHVIQQQQGEVQQLRSDLARRDKQTQELEKTSSRLKRDLLFQERRVTLLLEEARKRFPAPLSDGQVKAIADEDRHQLDALYVTLEDEFRGSREDIKDRLRVYLSFLREAGVGTAQMPLFDVGCGRGEWLELLKEEGVSAKGLDVNRVLVSQCRELGLDVIEEEAINYLKHLPAGCLGAVTGFHLIEHLPLELMIALLDETVRVLKPGGIAIFETPNPQNVLVGSCNFYMDPTHRNPIPPPVLQFLAEARGLCRVQVLTLNPLLRDKVVQEDSEVAKRFNEYFYGPLDYAVVGWKV